MLAGILVFLAFFIPAALIVAVLCMSEGWSPLESWSDLQEMRAHNKKAKRLLELEIREAELALEEREQALLERKLGM